MDQIGSSKKEKRAITETDHPVLEHEEYTYAAANPAAADATTTTGAVSGALRIFSDILEVAEAAATAADDTASVTTLAVDSAGGGDVLAFFFFFMSPLYTVRNRIQHIIRRAHTRSHRRLCFVDNLLVFVEVLAIFQPMLLPSEWLR